MYRRSAADRKAEAAVYRERTLQASIPTVSLADCEYNKERKVLKLASRFFSGRLPREFYVVSHKTGKEFRFVPVGEEDLLFDQDGWDGEMCVYRPVGHCPTVDHMVVSHSF